MSCRVRRPLVAIMRMSMQSLGLCEECARSAVFGNRCKTWYSVLSFEGISCTHVRILLTPPTLPPRARAPHGGRRKALDQIRLSCAEFTWVAKHGPGHLSVAREKDPELFVEELKLASDMAEMQTRNIARIESNTQ